MAEFANFVSRNSLRLVDEGDEEDSMDNLKDVKSDKVLKGREGEKGIDDDDKAERTGKHSLKLYPKCIFNKNVRFKSR